MSGGPDLEAARARIAGRAWRTPALNVPALDAACGREVWLKPEALQRTGSFKYRGATNAVRALPAGTGGVIAVSSGNHAQAVARAAAEAGRAATVVMNHDANPLKRAATEGYGADVLSEGVTALTRDEVVQELAAARGLHLIHPFDDWDVISGQATATLELIEDSPPLDAIVAPIGGGGLLAGAALAIESLAPHLQLVGAEPEAGPDAQRSLSEGRRVRLDAVPDTLADGARTVQIGERNLDVLQRAGARVVLVSDDQLREASALCWSRTKIVIEPTAALALAAVLAGAIEGERIGVILSGGNVDAARLARAL